jgi:predicted DNA-binding protein
MQVQLSKNGKRTKAYIHRLVAEAFLENNDCLSDVNHIDGNKRNNAVNNLEWVSHKDNQVHMVKNRMTKKAFPVVCVETMATYNSLSEAEKATGADRHGIKTSCETGKIYKGVHWRYANE